jgi:hypothetical protein
MTTDADWSHITDPNAVLERAIIEDFIRARGYDPGRLHDLPEGCDLRVLSVLCGENLLRIRKYDIRKPSCTCLG